MTVATHLSQFDDEITSLEVETLSSSTRNASLIREAVMAIPEPEEGKRLLLLGYSKGTPDILEAVTTFPDLQQRVAAVVSVAGAVGGSPLAYDATQSMLNWLQYFPGAECDPGDEGALDSLKPEVRKRWLANCPGLAPPKDGGMQALAQLTTHIPNKGEQMVRYYGYYSNKLRGLRKKTGTDDAVPALIESEVSSKAFRKNWACLI